jgi:hypothetical protein
MKKSMKIFSVLMALALVLTLGGCELWNRAKELVGPTNSWRRYDYTYNYNGSNITLYCYLIYVDKDGGYTTDGMKLPTDETRFPGGKLQKGLTVVITPKLETSSDQNVAVSLFGSQMNNKYVIKTFAEGQKVSMNSDGESSSSTDKKFTMNYVTWGVIYNSIHTNAPGLPPALNDALGFTELDGLANFSWKKLMAGMALQYLTGYLED